MEMENFMQEQTRVIVEMCDIIRTIEHLVEMLGRFSSAKELEILQLLKKVVAVFGFMCLEQYGCLNFKAVL
ncbi:hypothetical protein ATZ36_17390 [Candidatus Endomicrobiellum trichonymphae]|uniref:Uncharacterized protein n=1 Tax=Endomicrobium trichonymphae TaxID=1408204 RepID=A0A1E5IFZ4_ENDTX|nr:hypothetical protein ATZ36_09655 [Candidatus Endomicrobium trichonymphae]OEG70746.1 hypothetical protein ATZ36_17390 [Candidatus Endomicrobium trichonymphae]